MAKTLRMSSTYWTVNSLYVNPPASFGPPVELLPLREQSRHLIKRAQSDSMLRKLMFTKEECMKVWKRGDTGWLAGGVEHHKVGSFMGQRVSTEGYRVKVSRRHSRRANPNNVCFVFDGEGPKGEWACRRNELLALSDVEMLART